MTYACAAVDALESVVTLMKPSDHWADFHPKLDRFHTYDRRAGWRRATITTFAV
jgi:hypothetical protein